MARTVNRVRLNPSATHRRPPPFPGAIPGFSADLGLIHAATLDEYSVILLPDEYVLDFDDSPDASWRGEYNTNRCWQTTVIYEKQIKETHPHLVPFRGRDPWTGFPVLAKPSGPTVAELVKKDGAIMYTAPLNRVSSRVIPLHRPIMYQWALHFISVLSFIHDQDIILGEFDLEHLWLSLDAHLSLSLGGFVNAGFRNRDNGVWYHCSATSGKSFHPLEHQSDPTVQTDIFLYGCIVYEFMTGFWPGLRLGKSSQEIHEMILLKQWPQLEIEHTGEIVHKCWAGEFADAKELKTEVVAYVEGLGWTIEGDDDLQGLDVAKLCLNSPS